MKMIVKNWDNKEAGKVDLNPEVFGQALRMDILDRVVQWQLSKARSGNHKTKQRSEIAGSMKKIYRQKGTGQARHSTKKANIFVGGGVTFGPQVRSHAYKLNKKVRTLGLKVALSHKQAEGKLVIVESGKLDSFKTADFRKKLSDSGIKSALIVDVELDQNLVNASYNVPHVDVLPTVGINVYDILKHDTLVITQDALKAIEERLSC